MLVSLHFCHAADLQIPLTAFNRSDAGRVNELVVGGVPFPEGALYEDGLKKLGLFDNSGRQLPAQFTVLNRWWRERDRTTNAVNPPSVQWVLVSMPANVPAKGKAEYVLKTGVDAWTPDSTLKVEKTPEKITVVTGPLKFTVRKSGFNLLDEVWLDESGSSKFDDSTQLVASHEGGLFTFTSFGGNGGETSDFSTPAWLGKNKFYASRLDKEVKLSVEEEGPVRTVIRASGKHVAVDDQPGPKHLLDFEVWITACRGSPFVSVEYVFLCKQGNNLEDGFPIDGVYAELPLKPGRKNSFTFGKPGGTVAGALPENANAFVEVATSDKFEFGGAASSGGTGRTKSGLPMKYRWFYDQKNGVPLEGKEYPQYPSPDNLGWVDASDENGGVTAGIAKFWQTWPKGVEIRDGGKLRLHIWSNVKQEVRQMPKSHLESKGETMEEIPGYSQRWETLHSETVAGRGNIFPGMAKSTVFGFYFHGKPATLDMQKAWTMISQPVRLLCAPSWYCEKTRVFGYLASSNPDIYDPEIFKDIVEMDKVNKDTLEWIRTFRAKFYDAANENIDQYGCFYFGDSMNFMADRDKPRRIKTLWDNNYYDSSHTMFLQFYRTGDPDILEQAIETDTHLADVDMTCWHPNNEAIGCSRYSPSVDHIRHDWGVRTVWAPEVFSWHRVNFDRWCLFGNRWAYEQNLRAAEYVVRRSRAVNAPNENIGHKDRSAGHEIKNAVMGYFATGDKKFLQAAKRVWMPHRDHGSTQDGYQAGILCEGVWWYWQATGDPAALKQVVGKTSRKTWSGTKHFSYGLAFRLTGETVFTDVAYPKMKNIGSNKLAWGAMCDWAMACRNGLYFPWFVSGLPVEKQIPVVLVGE